MKILPIFTNKIYNPSGVRSLHKGNPNVFISQSNQYDTVSFTASKASGAPLKRLAEYGLPDMYTGQEMLTNGILSRMLKNGVFDFPLSRLVPILGKYKGALHDTELKLFSLLEGIAKKDPECKIDEALKRLFPEHQEKLLDVQRPIFRKIIQQACDMPKTYLDDLMALMRDTDKKIKRKDTTSHFSEKAFIYRLQQVAKQIKAKKRHSETSAINNIIREATLIFRDQIEEKKKFGRGFVANELKMKYQMQPEVLKQNIQKLQHLKEILDSSVLKNNRDIRNIFELANAKICGFPIAEPFKRQEFIYDLKNIVKFLRNKKIETEIVATAHKLPTSADNVSAFIVKHVNDTPEKIGYYMLKGSLVSIEHISPKVPRVNEDAVGTVKKKKKKKNCNSVSGKNHINNYGLASAHINSLRSNMPFDEWVREMPASYQACQKFVDRLIELYNAGKFKKVGLDKSYIPIFVKNVESLSPKEKPIVINISKLKE